MSEQKEKHPALSAFGPDYKAEDIVWSRCQKHRWASNTKVGCPICEAERDFAEKQTLVNKLTKSYSPVAIDESIVFGDRPARPRDSDVLALVGRMMRMLQKESAKSPDNTYLRRMKEDAEKYFDYLVNSE